jgi:soluble P-type ATPase
MMEVDIPGYGTLTLVHLVLDYNGTLARDGRIIDGVRDRLAALSGRMEIHVLTADTFGAAEAETQGTGCSLGLIHRAREAESKLQYIQKLGIEVTAAIGNGRNDHLMLEAAALGIAVIQAEGASTLAVRSADVVMTSILDALDCFMHPLRLTATLRS